MTGRTISNYHILEKLGEGGMGVVFKAEDTKLRRVVALKFLPRHATENRERFLREAQAAASLNHPNICTVHEIDDEQGFIVMEFIDGPNARSKIEARPLPLEEALDIAIQACTGLQAAHEKGIVHRDIKPANLMLTPQGQVKLMDFGLAQVGDRTRLTKSGTSMGTPAYMSPEQAQGLAVDRRTDIWSIGVVLYEMVAGRPPFRGDTEAACAYSIVNTEPEPLTALRTGVPKDLDRLIAKVLSKDPAKRYQHIDDFITDLRHIRISGNVPPASTNRFSRRTVLAFAICSIAVVLIAWYGRSWFNSKPPQAIQLSVSVAMDSQVADPGRLVGPPVIAPDGTAMVVALRVEQSSFLYFRRLDSPQLARMAGTQGASYPFWSPDSRSIAFFANGQLKKTSAGGGVPVVVCAAVDNRGGAWGRSGTMIFALWGRGLYRVPETGGEPSVLTTVDAAAGENGHRYPVFLPDGNRFLYFARNANRDNAGIYLESLDHKQPRKRVLAAAGQFAIGLDPYSNRNYLITQQADKIVAHRFLVDRGAVEGEPHVIHDVAGQVSISDTGTMVLRQEDLDRARMVWYDRNGNELGALGPEGNFTQIVISPDDRHMAVLRTDYLSGSFVIWLATPDQGFLGPVSDPSRHFADPVFSSDGRWLYFADQEGHQIFRKSVSSSGDVERIAQNDKQRVLLRGVCAHQECFLGELVGPGNRSEAVVWRGKEDVDWKTLITGGAESRPKLSPDGRWVAFDSVRSGTREVYVAGFPKSANTYRISSTGGFEPHWRGDGKEIFYLSADGFVWSVELRASGVFTSLQQRKLFRVQYVPSARVGPIFGVTHDGLKLLIISGKSNASQFSLNIVLNWPALLDRAGKP